MNLAQFNPSFNVSNLITDELREDSELFLLFLQAYYEWLETSTFNIDELVGTFQRDETIVGSISGATAIIKQLPTGKIVVKIKSIIPFEIDETVTGSTSGATATIISIKDNVIRASGEILNYRNTEKAVDKYVEYLKSELYSSLPGKLEVDKRFIARKFRDFFESKSNEKSYQFLFRSLFNENIELRYPGENILRVSDGKFEKTQIIRAEVKSNIFDYIGQTISGRTSNALANVIDIKLFFIGAIEVAEITLKLVSGTFESGETIEILNTPTSNTTVYGMVTGFTINDGGSGYAIGDNVIITSNTGSEAEAVVSSIKQSPISAINLNTPGHGYRLNTEAVINNSGTGGSDLLIRVTGLANTYTVNTGATTYTVGETSKVSIINRGQNYYRAPTITLTDTAISSLGLLTDKLVTIANTGSYYGVGNTLIITGGSGANAAGRVASISANASYSNTLLFEDGFEMLSEDSYDDVIKTEDWNVLGPIRRIEFTNFGDGYTSANLPSITVSSTTGSNANLIVTGIQGSGANVTVDVANNITGIGSIRAIRITDFGISYNTSNTTASLASSGDGNANVTPIVTGIGTSEGAWINDDGKIDYKIIQDSDFYSDFSYVIRTGLTIDRWSNIIKEIIHPAGLKFFGEILIISDLIVTSDFISDLKNYTITFLSTANGGVIDASSIITMDSIEPEIESLIELYEMIDASATILPKYIVSKESEVSASITSSSTELIINPNLNANTSLGSISDATIISIESVNSFATILPVPEYIVFKESEVSASITSSSTELIINPNLNANTSLGSISDATIISIESVNSFESLIIEEETNKYLLITGNVTYSGPGATFANTLISDYANITIESVAYSTLETQQLFVTGTGTNFLTDFASGDIMVANNEYLTIINVLSNTKLTISIAPTALFTNVPAYKQI